MSEIVVFGGNGFIGGHLVRALVDAGHRVRIASRGASPVQEAGRNPREIRADVSDRASVDAAIAGAELVVNLASGGGARWADFERDFIGGARNVAESCLSNGVRRLVYTSSSAALYLAGRGALDESDGADPQPEARADYSRAKIAAESLLLGMHRDAKLPVVVLRPCVVLGAGGLLAHTALGSWVSPTRCIGRGPGDSPMPFVLVRDVVQAIVAALEAPNVDGLTFNLAGDVRPTAQEYVAEIASRTARDVRFRPRAVATHYAIDLAKWALKAAGGKKENRFPSWRDFASRRMRRQIDCRAAKRLLGWMPCNDPRAFFDEAIGPHLRPVVEGDLRFAAPT